MTLLDAGRQESHQESHLESSGEGSPTLTTQRLLLRAPRAADAKAFAGLINDRRIAENTARIPHPYAVADAQAFVAESNRDPGAPSFLITLADGTLIGGRGIQGLDG